MPWHGRASRTPTRRVCSPVTPDRPRCPTGARGRRAGARERGNRCRGAHGGGEDQFLFDWDWRGAETNLRHAVALDPSSGQSHWMLGHALSQQGRHDEALAAARRARELDPLDALTHSMSSQIAFSARDLEAAVSHAREALLAEPDFWVAYWQLGQAYQQMGRTDQALEALAEASRLSNGNSKPVSVSAYTLATSGRAREARAVLTALEQPVARALCAAVRARPRLCRPARAGGSSNGWTGRSRCATPTSSTFPWIRNGIRSARMSAFRRFFDGAAWPGERAGS